MEVVDKRLHRSDATERSMCSLGVVSAGDGRRPGAAVTWTTNAGTASGVTAGIDALGALLVKVDGRIERIVSGEVLWL